MYAISNLVCLFCIVVFRCDAFFCCASSGGTCNACSSRYSPLICGSNTTCITRCGGLSCFGNVSSVETHNCSTGTDFGGIRIQGFISVPSSLLHMSTSSVHRRMLLLSNHAIGIMRAVPGFGFFAAIATPEYDENRGADLTAELIDANNRIGSLADTVAELANKSETETYLRVEGQKLLYEMIDSVVLSLNDQLNHVQKQFTLIANSLFLLTARVYVAEQQAIYLSHLSNNLALARAPISSSLVQKFLKLGFIGLYSHQLNISSDISPDTFSFLIRSGFIAMGVGDEVNRCGIDVDCGVFICAEYVEVSVLRRPTAFSFLGVPGDNYLYEVSYRPVSMVYEKRQPGGSSTSCADNLAACRTNPYVGCKTGGNAGEPYSLGCQFSCSSGACVHYAPGAPDQGQPIITPGMCTIWNISNCVPGEGRVCDNNFDFIGARPTFVFLPHRLIDDPYVYSYASVFNGSTFVPSNLSGYIHYTEFFDPIYIAKKYFHAREFSLPSFFSDLLYSGNGQDNVVFGDFGSIVSVPVGFLTGDTTPVILDPTLFSSSYDIISWYQGSPPFSGWAPNDGCFLENGHMCCSEFIINELLATVVFQLGYNGSHLPVEYSPRNLFSSYLYLFNLISSISSSTNVTIPQSLIDGLAANVAASAELADSFSVIKAKANNISRDSAAANVRLANLESSSSVNYGLLIALFVILGIVALCICYFCMRSRSSLQSGPIRLG